MIVLIGLFAMWFAEVGQIAQKLMNWLCEKRLIYKTVARTPMAINPLPFSCSKCLGFWLGLAYFVFTSSDIVVIIISAGLSSLVAQTACLIYYKYLLLWQKKEKD